jgi:hypothetical protein
MTRERDEERAGTPAQDSGAGGAIPSPTAEEVPELLGERSDYPVPFGEEPPGAGGARREEEEPRAHAPPE